MTPGKRSKYNFFTELNSHNQNSLLKKFEKNLSTAYLDDERPYQVIPDYGNHQKRRTLFNRHSFNPNLYGGGKFAPQAVFLLQLKNGWR